MQSPPSIFIYVFTSQEPSHILYQVPKPPTQATCSLLDTQTQLYPLFLAKNLYAVSCFDQDFIAVVITISKHSFLVPELDIKEEIKQNYDITESVPNLELLLYSTNEDLQYCFQLYRHY